MCALPGGPCFDEHRAFDQALAGDDAELRRIAGPNAVFCLDAANNSALLVRTAPDGSQAGTVHLPNALTSVEIPRAFRVRDIHRADGWFVLTSTDGRSVRGTARQFRMRPLLVPEEVNPDYQDQLARIFADTHLLPDEDAGPEAFPPIQDSVLGAVTCDGEYFRQYSASVPYPGGVLVVSFDCAGFDHVTESLPQARRPVTSITELHDAVRDLLWEFAADGTEEPAEREHFDAVVLPGDLTLFRSGDFELAFEDDGSFIPDAHWLAVSYRADGTPVAAALHA